MESSSEKLADNMNKNITYNTNTKFEVCNHEELVEKGWRLLKTNAGRSKIYEHDDFKKGGVITYSMIEDNQGQTLTIIGASINFVHWYYVKENANLWPVATFLEDINAISNGCTDSCVEGQTPILGWFICKICGDNLRKIK